MPFELRRDLGTLNGSFSPTSPTSSSSVFIALPVWRICVEFAKTCSVKTLELVTVVSGKRQLKQLHLYRIQYSKIPFISFSKPNKRVKFVATSVVCKRVVVGREVFDVYRKCLWLKGVQCSTSTANACLAVSMRL